MPAKFPLPKTANVFTLQAIKSLMETALNKIQALSRLPSKIYNYT